MAMKETISNLYPKSSDSDVRRDQDGYELDVLAAESNQEQHTYDGIDWGGERLVAEVRLQDRILSSSSLPISHLLSPDPRTYRVHRVFR